jgi:alpha-galactosidase
MYECSAVGGIYYDPKATRAQACRKGLQAIRDGFGDRFILGGTTVLGPAVGIVNGERIGTDITPYWKPNRNTLPKEAPCLPNVCRNIINRRYMHGKLWLNDPDVHIARIDNNKLTEDEVILWTSALWLVGGLKFVSDRFRSLSPERQKLSRLLLESTDCYETRPLDLFENEYPSIWLGRKQNIVDDHAELMLGLFNFDDIEKSFSISRQYLGITYGIDVDLYDLWSEKALETMVDNITMILRHHSCKLLRITYCIKK